MLGRGIAIGFVMACGGTTSEGVKNVAPVTRPPAASIAPAVSWTLEAGPGGPLALARFATSGQASYVVEVRGEVETSGMTDPHTTPVATAYKLGVTSAGTGHATVRMQKVVAGSDADAAEAIEIDLDASGKASRPRAGEVIGLFLPVAPTGLAVGATQERPFRYPLAMETGTVQTGTEQVTFRGYTTVGGTACAWFELQARIEIPGGENEIHGTGTYDRHVCFDPRDASLVAASIGTDEDITVVSTTTFADGESYGPMKSRRVSKLQHVITRE